MLRRTRSFSLASVGVWLTLGLFALDSRVGTGNAMCLESSSLSSLPRCSLPASTQCFLSAGLKGGPSHTHRTATPSLSTTFSKSQGFLRFSPPSTQPPVSGFLVPLKASLALTFSAKLCCLAELTHTVEFMHLLSWSH